MLARLFIYCWDTNVWKRKHNNKMWAMLWGRDSKHVEKSCLFRKSFPWSLFWNVPPVKVAQSVETNLNTYKLCIPWLATVGQWRSDFMTDNFHEPRIFRGRNEGRRGQRSRCIVPSLFSGNIDQSQDVIMGPGNKFFFTVLSQSELIEFLPCLIKLFVL